MIELRCKMLKYRVDEQCSLNIHRNWKSRNMKFLDALASLGKVGGGGRRNLKGGNDGSEASAWPNWFKFPGIGPDRLQGKVNGGRRIGRKARRGRMTKRRWLWRKRRRRWMRRIGRGWWWPLQQFPAVTFCLWKRLINLFSHYHRQRPKKAFCSRSFAARQEWQRRDPSNHPLTTANTFKPKSPTRNSSNTTI